MRVRLATFERPVNMNINHELPEDPHDARCPPAASALIPEMPPTDPDLLDPYRRFKRLSYGLAFAGFASIALRKMFPHVCVSLFVIAFLLAGAPLIFYLLVREKRAVKERMQRYRGVRGHCTKCGWYQSDKSKKRCIQCMNSLEAQS